MTKLCDDSTTANISMWETIRCIKLTWFSHSIIEERKDYLALEHSNRQYQRVAHSAGVITNKFAKKLKNIEVSNYIKNSRYFLKEAKGTIAQCKGSSAFPIWRLESWYRFVKLNIQHSIPLMPLSGSHLVGILEEIWCTQAYPWDVQTDPNLMIWNLHDLVTEPDLTRLKKWFTIMWKLIWTKNSISNQPEINPMT